MTDPTSPEWTEEHQVASEPKPSTRDVIENARQTLLRVPARYNLILTTESWQEINDAADALQVLLDGKCPRMTDEKLHERLVELRDMWKVFDELLRRLDPVREGITECLAQLLCEHDDEPTFEPK